MYVQRIYLEKQAQILFYLNSLGEKDSYKFVLFSAKRMCNI